MEAKIRQQRKKIDEIDKKIVLLLHERVEICKDIGEEKRIQGLPVNDAKREEEVYNHVRERATELSLNPTKIEAVYREIVNICKSVQE